MKRIPAFLAARRESVILALMLEFLHGAIWFDFGSLSSRSLMLIQFGLFLIWQPVWRSDEKLAWYNGTAFILLTLAFVTWMNWWLLYAWLILLVGFCGGRVAVSRRERGLSMLVLAFLTSELLIACTTELFDIPLPRNIRDVFGVLLPIMPVIVVLLSAPSDARALHSVDILQAIAAATLVTLLIIGSLINMYRNHVDYLLALVHTLLAIGVFLFAISWLLTPRMRFSGLSQLWLRSILNIGTPFERWLNELSVLFRQRTSPDEFLDSAMEELTGHAWIAGVTWTAEGSQGEHGSRTPHATEFRMERLTARIFTHAPLGGALFLHCKLLLHLVDDFYVARLHQRELTKRTHLQAIYETGARITHDIKNLLQSLQAITSIIQQEEAGGESVSQKLLRRQLPHLTQRLQLALDKLQDPAVIRYEEVYLKDWWRDLQNRSGRGTTRFQSDIAGDPTVPADLFDSVVENLLENVKDKAQIEPGLAVTVALYSDGSLIQLSICDNGTHLAEEKARLLFHEPLPSDSGLGVGLYQVARLAESLGFALFLSANVDGRVCFELSNRIAAPAASAAASAPAG
ncbi:MAG: HAMP domain-containing histidine kinase [Gammaproteobacteria bacterium]|nr:HAMP domain-containing histidine kinase [Gammaproteobacteria bacterium]